MIALRSLRGSPLAAALLLIGLVSIGLGLRGCTDPGPAPVHVVYLDSTEYYRAAADTRAELLARVLHENTGLRGALTDARNRIRGLEARRPDTIYAIDTLIAPPDSLPIIREITPGGRAQFELLVLARETLAYRPHLYDVDVRDCDRGIVAGPTGLVCRTAPFGHLSVFARIGVGSQLGGTPHPLGAVGASWTPAYRSGWRIEAGVDLERRGFVSIERGIRLFEPP